MPVVLASSFLYAMRWFELAATFHPEPYSSTQEWELPAGAEEVFFTNADRLQLHGWFVSSRSKPSSATVVFFHGNGGNIRNVGLIGESLAERGLDVLLFDYRGYGKSQGKITNEQDLYADASAAYDYVVKKRGVSPERVILYGHSLGTAAVADLAVRTRCAAIILESGFSSASAMASAMLPWLPQWLHSMGKNRLETARKLASVHCPTLIVHGEPDTVVPTREGLALFEAANEPKQLKLMPGAGHVVFGSSGEKYFDEIAKFIQQSIL